MPTAPQLHARHRLPALAVLLSAAVHAAIMAGMPRRNDSFEDAKAAIYEATLEARASLEPAPPAPRAAPAPRRAPRPRAPARVPADVLAALPLEGASELSPESASEPAPELAAAPDIVALAQPAAPRNEPPLFPVDAIPPELSIEYHLTSVVADGRATYRWEREGDSYRIRGEAEAEGFLTLFLEGRVSQESRGKVGPAGLKPERFTEQRPNAWQEGLRFDWEGRTVTFERNNEARTTPLEDNTVDWLSMIFQLAHLPPSGDTMELQVFTQRRMYRFRLQVLGVEEIEIPLGRVRALHLRHQDAARGNETVDVWLGLDQHNLPVKMRYPAARNRVTVEQVATSVRGSPR